jgi:hypothetical protein
MMLYDQDPIPATNSSALDGAGGGENQENAQPSVVPSLLGGAGPENGIGSPNFLIMRAQMQNNVLAKRKVGISVLQF